jgi:hypothetical protein
LARESARPSGGWFATAACAVAVGVTALGAAWLYSRRSSEAPAADTTAVSARWRGRISGIVRTSSQLVDAAMQAAESGRGDLAFPPGLD